MSSRFNSLFRVLVRKKNDVALIALWSLLIAFVIIRIHWSTYQEVFMLRYYEIPFTSSQGPSPGPIDLAMVAIAGVIVGLFLSDVKEMVYGFLFSTFFSFVAGVLYVTIYIWYSLGWSSVLGMFAYDWEIAVYWAVATVFRIMFPWLIGLSLIGLAVAAFLRTWIFWS